MAETWVSVTEAARRLGVNVRTVRRWVSQDAIPHKEAGGRRLVDIAGHLAADTPPDIASDNATLKADNARLVAECDKLRTQVAMLSDEVSYLRSALAAALSLQQRALPAPRRAWWRFWRRDDGGPQT